MPVTGGPYSLQRQLNSFTTSHTGRRVGNEAFHETNQAAIAMRQIREPKLSARLGSHQRSELAKQDAMWRNVFDGRRFVTVTNWPLTRGLHAMGMCNPGKLVVVVSGSRSGVAGSTDSMRVLRIE
jgi:pyruvate kinase